MKNLQLHSGEQKHHLLDLKAELRRLIGHVKRNSELIEDEKQIRITSLKEDFKKAMQQSHQNLY